MSISFNQIPANLRVPFYSVEFDASEAAQGPALLDYRALIIGQKITAGTGVANTLYLVTNADAVATLAGRGSMLHRQALAWFHANKFTEVWIGILDDDGAGTAATGTITVTGTMTETAPIYLYLGGVRLTVSVTSGDSVTDVADAITAAVTAAVDLPVTAANTLGVVTLTFRHKGLAGNEYNARDSYNPGERLPTGVALAYVQLASGATNPTLTTLIAALGDTWFHVWTHPYTDATSLSAIEAEFASRNDPLRMIDGIAVTSKDDTHSNLTTLGNGRNSQFSSIMSQPGKIALTPPMEHAANIAAQVAKFGQIDPARPHQTLPLSWCMPPAEVDLFTIAERNLLLGDGIGTTKVVGGVMQIGRTITTYQTNASGGADTAYLDVTTILTLLYLRFSWRTRLQAKYPRHKLADDGTRFGPGQKVMTPKLGKVEALGWFREQEKLGLVEGFDQFKEDLIVVRNADPNRMDWKLSPDLINQLVVGASQIAFRL